MSESKNWPTANSDPIKIVGTEEAQEKAPEEKTVEAPPHAVFKKGEFLAMKGWEFRFKGYAMPGFMPVFEPVGRTAKSLKKMRTG